MSESPYLDATVELVRDATPVEGAPDHAFHYASRDLALAVWGPATGFGHDTWALAQTPAGQGGAWIKGVPANITMQTAGLAAASGDQQVTLRRNGPRWRLRNRIITVEGFEPAWEIRTRGASGTTMRRGPDGPLVFERVGNQHRVAADAGADEVALALLLMHQNVETHLSSLRWLQGL